MLPPFHGERMRSYEPVVEEIVDAEIDTWPLGEAFALHPRMQAVTLEVILRAVFGVAERAAAASGCASVLPTLLQETASPRAQLSVSPRRRFGGRGPWARFEAQLRRGRRAALRRDRRAPRAPRPRGARRHPLDADAGPLRGRRGDERHRAARPADDAAAGRPRDDRDRRWPGPSTCCCATRRRSSGCASRSRRARTTTCGRRSPSRCGCARWCRSRGAGSPRSSRSTA